ncbi:putative acetylornithine transaminase [Wallemia mellicola]|nr:putative acetylornithine transaminase [Wallemia mellicola]
MSAGIAVNGLGHADDGVSKVLGDQSSKLVHNSNLYHNEWSGELAHLLTTLTKQHGGLGYVKGSSTEGAGLKAFFANSGTEANEGALKFARVSGKQHSADKVELVCFNNAFHGRSMGGLSVTSNPKYQDPFAPLIPGVKVGNVNDVPALTELVTEKTCGVIIEPIQGEGGIHNVDLDFLIALRKRCDEVGAVLIYDEIQCGLFRSTNMWAHSDFPVEAHPDLITMAKPLANGFPIGAILMRDSVANNVSPGSHGTTFGGSPLSTAVAHHVLTRLSQLPDMKSRAELLKERLNQLAAAYPDLIKSEVRGRGFLLGVPFKDTAHPGKALSLARERGLLILVAGSDAVRIVPSLTISEEEINKACDIFEAVLEVLRKELAPAEAVEPSTPTTGILNKWALIKNAYREELAEFLSTFVLIVIGAGVNCQYTLQGSGVALSVPLTWAFGVAGAVWIAGGISGGHLNPVVTISLAIFRGFPWRKVPSYTISQVLGCFAGACVAYANYHYSIDQFEDGLRTIHGPTATGGLFFTMPQPYLPALNCFFDEFLGTAILVGLVFALSDKSNLSPPHGTMPFALFLTIFGLGAALGGNTAGGFNPARDFGPRLMAWFMGYGNEVWSFFGQYWFWCGWLAPISGGIAGAFVYDAFIYSGADSPVNTKKTHVYESGVIA